jgi:hypothetical protein
MIFMKFVSVIVLSALLLSASSCSEENQSIPSSVVTRDTMVMIFTDLHLLEGLYIHNSVSENDSVKNTEAYRQGLFEKYSISKERFEESYNWYISNPELLDGIYSEVLNELSRMKAETENLSSEKNQE